MVVKIKEDVKLEMVYMSINGFGNEKTGQAVCFVDDSGSDRVPAGVTVAQQRCEAAALQLVSEGPAGKYSV